MLGKAELDQMRVYMEAVSTDGMASGWRLNAVYMITHADSLVGKELKLWLQCAAGFLAPLVSQGKVSRELWLGWHTTGQLARVLLTENVAESDLESYYVSRCTLLLDRC